MKKYKLNPHWVCGDFNLPDIDWETNTIARSQYSKQLNEVFLEAFDVLNLNQLVDFTTRKKATLDLILTNQPGLTDKCEPHEGFGDHETAVIADFFFHPQKLKLIQRKIYVWHIEGLQKDITEGIHNFCATNTTVTDIDKCWETFKQIILNAQDKHVPTKTTSQRFNQPWFNVVCKKAIRKKSRRYRVYKRTKLDQDWKRYQQAAKFARKTCQNVYNTYIKENICDDKKNSKKFFSFVKSKRTDICGVSPLLDENNI